MLVKVARPGIVDHIAGLLTWHLAQADPVSADADVTFADLTEATFAGYAAVGPGGMAFPAAALDVPLHGESDSPVVTFTPTGVGLPQTIYGVYGTAASLSPDTLVFWRRFSVPFVITTVSDILAISVALAADDSNVPAFFP